MATASVNQTKAACTRRADEPTPSRQRDPTTQPKKTPRKARDKHGMDSQASLNASIEAWIDHIIRTGGPTIIMPDERDALPTTVERDPTTPRKANKRQRQSSGELRALDPEKTPRPSLPYRDTNRDSQSDAPSVSSATTSRTSQSGRSSPRKKEAALRRTLDWPVARLNLAELKSIPAGLETLALDLQVIADGREALIPGVFRESMCAEAGFLRQPRPEWFYVPSADHDEEELSATHNAMRKICRNTWKCTDKMEYEPAWNDLVHCRVLEESMEGQSSVDFRNITLCRTIKEFHDDDPGLRENKVDYGIFLQPSQGSDGLSDRLSDLAAEGVHVTHFALSDFAPTPLAISIETKTLQAKASEGPVQLANWARAHFRQLARVVERRGHAASLELPILPLIYVFGNTWRVDFAHRRDGNTIIYRGITVGDTDTVYGCYQVCSAIRRLARWVETDFRAWWVQVARVAQRPASADLTSQP